jgi:hypothetical protein
MKACSCRCGISLMFTANLYIININKSHFKWTLFLILYCVIKYITRSYELILSPVPSENFDKSRRIYFSPRAWKGAKGWTLNKSQKSFAQNVMKNNVRY